MLTFISCEHSSSEFKLQNSFQIKLQNPVRINVNDWFYFSADSNLYQLFMYYSNTELGNAKLIDTISREVELSIGSTKSPKLCRTPIVIAKIKEAAIIVIQIFFASFCIVSPSLFLYFILINIIKDVYVEIYLKY